MIGDIEAMWLRDSSNQVLPYLPYITRDQPLNDMIKGLIRRHAKSVLINPFANAFNYNTSSGHDHQSDITKPPMTAAVFESKYEIDSLCAFLKLSYWYWRYEIVMFYRRRTAYYHVLSSKNNVSSCLIIDE